LKNVRRLSLGILLLATAFTTGCGAMTAETGDTVEVSYILTLEDGTVYYTSEGNELLEATLGEGELIQGFEEALIGMREGDIKTVTVLPSEAYGQVRLDLIEEVDKSRLPVGFVPEVGKTLQTTLNGSAVLVVITQVGETTVTVDANHPLAGKTLTFEIELVSIAPRPTPEVAVPVWGLWAAGALALLLVAGNVIFFLRSRRSAA